MKIDLGRWRVLKKEEKNLRIQMETLNKCFPTLSSTLKEEAIILTYDKKALLIESMVMKSNYY